MKRHLLFLLGLIISASMFAQTPQGISHQAVMRDAYNNLIIESPIGLQVSILQGAHDGDAVYVETHNVTTNTNGLITYIIGNGNVVDGVFEEIDWGAGPYWLETKADPDGGTNYTISGITQFLSVPYALYSETAKVAESFTTKPPKAIATEATDISEFSATINGIVNGEGFLTNVVFEWGTTPSYGNTVTAIPSPITGSNDVQVSAVLSNLQAATTYHYRIRATNAVDIVYSEDMIFTTDASNVYNLSLEVNPEASGTVTGAGEYEEGSEVSITATPEEGWAFVNWTGENQYLDNPNSPNTTVTMPSVNVTLTANFQEEESDIIYGDGVTDIDGNEYVTVIIGNQEWMAENLRVTKYNNGDVIPTGLSFIEWEYTTEGVYGIYSHNADNAGGINSQQEMVDAYGKAYNWYAVDDDRGLCPEGWSVPGDNDWTQLVDYLVTQGFTNEGANPNGAGNALKSCRQVDSPVYACNTSVHPRWEASETHNGINQFGFSALPGANICSNGDIFHAIGYAIHFWTSTEYSAITAYGRGFYYEAGDIVLKHNLNKNKGLSIRCFRELSDEPTLFNLQLEVIPENAGSVTGAGEYQEGEQVNITATPEEGWEFVEWTGDTEHLDDADSAATVVTMPSDDITLIAIFQLFDSNLPIIVTREATDITLESAVLGGEVLGDGGYSVLARGVCWSTQEEPTLEDSFQLEGEGIGLFTSTLTGLIEQTTYYARAFATNTNGVAYGNQVSFITFGLPTVVITSLNKSQPGYRILDGEVIDNGGADITARGFVWDTEENPTLEQNTGYSQEGEGIGSFSSELIGLTPNTTYNVRAYATNREGTGYSDQLFFVFWDYHGTVTDIDGNVYNTVMIGNQEWMVENLRTSKYRSHIPITSGLTSLEWEATVEGAYAFYNNDEDMLEAYGKLYNWYAVNHSFGLCPEGWSVPSDSDWTELVDYGVAQGFPNASTALGIGNAIKTCRQIGSVLGGECDTHEHPRWDYQGTHQGFDEFGFSALPGGVRNASGHYTGMGGIGDWWSSSEHSSVDAWCREMHVLHGNIGANVNSKKFGMSVRCFREAVRILDE